MAKCPKCGYALKPWNIRAECPSCGVNIPNYNWEERLEEDAVKAEASFAVFNEKMGNLKKGLFGNAINIARFVLTFVPLASLILPIAKAEWYLPYLTGPTAKSFTILNLAMHIIGGFDFKALFALAKDAVLGKAFTFFVVALVLIVLAVLVGVLNLLMLVINSFSLKYKTNIALCLISAVAFIASYFCLSQFFTAIDATTVNIITGAMSYGYFVGTALFLLNAVMNIIAPRSLKKEKAKA